MSNRRLPLFHINCNSPLPALLPLPLQLLASSASPSTMQLTWSSFGTLHVRKTRRGEKFNQTQPLVTCFLSPAVVLLYGLTTIFNGSYNISPFSGNFSGPFSIGLPDYSSINSLGFANFQFIFISVFAGLPLLLVNNSKTSWSAGYFALFTGAITMLWAQLLKGFWWNGRMTYFNTAQVRGAAFLRRV
jgi:hypothetical protein